MAQFGGGIAKMRTHLARELISRGYSIDLLIGKKPSPYLEFLHPGIKIISIPTTHHIMSLPFILTYLISRKPAALITERPRVNMSALSAKSLLHIRTPIYSSVHLPLSMKINTMQPQKRKKFIRSIRKNYLANNGIIAVSQGVADDLKILLHDSKELIRTIHNPVITSDLYSLAHEELPHSWFQAQSPPVILSVGRLVQQKDHATLIRAFAILRRKVFCRLIILGEGGERTELEQLIRTLGLNEDIDLPGFVPNPYSYMAKSNLFVLSSAWEGFGNVLVEAMALGVPCVSTNCPFGPAEILEEGRLGFLVPVRDVQALANAMHQMLERPFDTGMAKEASQKYSAQTCADKYVSLIKETLPH